MYEYTVCVNSIHSWWSRELARWKHFYQMLLKANPPTPVPTPQPSPPPPSPRSCLNNEVTSPSWLQPRRKKSIVSITMRKNEGPLLMRRMWCPCPSNPWQHFPPPAPCHTHLTPTLPASTGPSLTVTLSSNLRGK